MQVLLHVDSYLQYTIIWRYIVSTFYGSADQFVLRNRQSDTRKTKRADKQKTYYTVLQVHDSFSTTVITFIIEKIRRIRLIWQCVYCLDTHRDNVHCDNPLLYSQLPVSFLKADHKKLHPYDETWLWNRWQTVWQSGRELEWQSQ